MGSIYLATCIGSKLGEQSIKWGTVCKWGDTLVCQDGLRKRNEGLFENTSQKGYNIDVSFSDSKVLKTRTSCLLWKVVAKKLYLSDNQPPLHHHHHQHHCPPADHHGHWLKVVAENHIVMRRMSMAERRGSDGKALTNRWLFANQQVIIERFEQQVTILFTN